MEKGKREKKEVKYPQIVSTAPCNDDWFEGQSHKRIASKIADIILEDSQHGIIGIDGGWGSGKSNLVGLTHKAINEKIKDKSFFENDTLLDLMDFVNDNNGALHMIGLISSSNVNSCVEHFYATLALAKIRKIK